jgi:hypothetical protein
MKFIFKYFIFILFVLFFFSCQSIGGLHKSKKQKIVDQIIQNSFIKINKKTGLVPFGRGAEMMDEVKLLGLYFNSKKKISINEARELLVCAADEFLSEINCNEEIRPYLSKYPFEIENIEIEIYTPRDRMLGDLAVVSITKGFLVYENSDFSSLEVVFKETYEEGVQKRNLKAG